VIMSSALQIYRTVGIILRMMMGASGSQKEPRPNIIIFAVMKNTALIIF